MFGKVADAGVSHILGISEEEPIIDSVSSVFDIDGLSADLECPSCRFSNRFTIKQARIRDVLICRGCHVNVRLDDDGNTVRRTHSRVRRALVDLEETLKAAGGVITLQL